MNNSRRRRLLWPLIAIVTVAVNWLAAPALYPEYSTLITASIGTIVFVVIFVQLVRTAIAERRRRRERSKQESAPRSKQ